VRPGQASHQRQDACAYATRHHTSSGNS